MNAYDPYDDGATQMQSNQSSEEAPDSTDKSLNSDQKKAIGAAAVGTVALGGAAYGLSVLDGEDSDGEGEVVLDTTPDKNAADDSIGQGSANLAAAQPTAGAGTGTSAAPPDPLAGAGLDPGAGLTGFDKAFAEARFAQGPGHTFEYEGETYNTYTKEEELLLTPEQRNEFLASNDLLPHRSGGGGHHQEEAQLARHQSSVSLDEGHVSLDTDDTKDTAEASTPPAEHEVVALHATETSLDATSDEDASVGDLGQDDASHDFDSHSNELTI